MVPAVLSCLVLVPYQTDLWRNLHLGFWTSSSHPPSFATPILLSPYRTTSSPISADWCKQWLFYSPWLCGEFWKDESLWGSLWGQVSLLIWLGSQEKRRRLPQRGLGWIASQNGFGASLKYSLWGYHQNVLWRSKNSYRTTIYYHVLTQTRVAINDACIFWCPQSTVYWTSLSGIPNLWGSYYWGERKIPRNIWNKLWLQGKAKQRVGTVEYITCASWDEND